MKQQLYQRYQHGLNNKMIAQNSSVKLNIKNTQTQFKSDQIHKNNNNPNFTQQQTQQISFHNKNQTQQDKKEQKIVQNKIIQNNHVNYKFLYHQRLLQLSSGNLNENVVKNNQWQRNQQKDQQEKQIKYCEQKQIKYGEQIEGLQNKKQKGGIYQQQIYYYDEQNQILICQLCQQHIQDKEIQQDLIYLCQCQHFYCRSCLLEYVKHKINTYKQAQCPNQQCNYKINLDGQFFKSLPPPFQQKYKKIHKFYFISNDPYLKHCPQQNCQGIILSIQYQSLQCQTCLTIFCLQCFLPIHQGQCGNAQKQYIENKFKYKRCQQCKTFIDKIDGCNHITCTVCKYQFCYVCGIQWPGVHDHQFQSDRQYSDQNQQPQYRIQRLIRINPNLFHQQQQIESRQVHLVNDNQMRRYQSQLQSEQYNFSQVSYARRSQGSMIESQNIVQTRLRPQLNRRQQIHPMPIQININPAINNIPVEPERSTLHLQARIQQNNIQSNSIIIPVENINTSSKTSSKSKYYLLSRCQQSQYQQLRSQLQVQNQNMKIPYKTINHHIQQLTKCQTPLNTIKILFTIILKLLITIILTSLWILTYGTLIISLILLIICLILIVSITFYQIYILIREYNDDQWKNTYFIVKILLFFFMFITTILFNTAIYQIMKSKIGILVFKLLLSLYKSIARLFKYVWQIDSVVQTKQIKVVNLSEVIIFFV